MRYQRLGRVHRLTQRKDVLVVDVRGPALEDEKRKEADKLLQASVERVAESLRERFGTYPGKDALLEQARIELAMQMPGLDWDALSDDPSNHLDRAVRRWALMRESVPELPPADSAAVRAAFGFAQHECAEVTRQFIRNWTRQFGGGLESVREGEVFSLALPDGHALPAGASSQTVVFEQDWLNTEQTHRRIAPGDTLLDAMIERAASLQDAGRCALLRTNTPGVLRRMFVRRHLYYWFLFSWTDLGGLCPTTRCMPVLIDEKLQPVEKVDTAILHLPLLAGTPPPADRDLISWAVKRSRPQEAVDKARELFRAEHPEAVNPQLVNVICLVAE